MKDFLTEHLMCITDNCKSTLYVDCVNSVHGECVEGFLRCNNCHAAYPIIEGVPIIVQDFAEYISRRPKVLGRWLITCESDLMKRFLRKKSKEVKDVSQNRYEEGGAWFKPYLQMHSAGARTERHYSRIVKGSFSEFYDNVTDLILKKFPNCSMCLDLGCAIGIGTSALARKYSVVLGVDQSFSFVWEARRRNDSHNLEFLVADTLKLPFPNGMFDLIIALNILDLLEPSDFLMHVKELSRKNGELVIADPYDFRDQKGDPQNIHDGKSIRRMLRSNGYVIDKDFRHESYLPWIIRINRRAYLVYFADFIIAKKLLP